MTQIQSLNSRCRRISFDLRCVGAFLVMALFVQLAAAASSPDVAKVAAQAAEALGRQDFAAAQSLYEQIVQREPEMAEAYSNLGYALYMQGQYAPATLRLKRAIALKPELTRAGLLLALCYFNTNQFSNALPILEKIYAEDHSNLLASQYLALGYLKLKEVEKAIAPLNTWLELDPNNPDVLYHRGQAFFLLGIESYERLERIAPDSYRVHQLKAELLRHQGHVEPAIGEFRKAIAAGSSVAGLHFALAELLWENKRLDEALAEYDEERKLSPNDPLTQYKIGNILLQKNDPSTSKALERALTLDSNLVEAYRDLSQVLRSQGNFAEAAKKLQAAIRLDPRRAELHYMLFDVYRQSGQKGEAASELQIFQKLKAAAAKETPGAGMVTR